MFQKYRLKMNKMLIFKNVASRVIRCHQMLRQDGNKEDEKAKKK